MLTKETHLEIKQVKRNLATIITNDNVDFTNFILETHDKDQCEPEKLALEAYGVRDIPLISISTGPFPERACTSVTKTI